MEFIFLLTFLLIINSIFEYPIKSIELIID